ADDNVTLAYFNQAEDGVRDRTVTAVQTCALPISGTDVDTENATVSTVALSDPHITDADSAHTVTATITFSEDMDQTVDPTVSNKIGRASCRERVEKWMDAG